MIGQCPTCGNPLAQEPCLICKYGLADKVATTQTTTQTAGLPTPLHKLYFQVEYDKQVRDPSTALVLALLLGGLGAHRIYLRQWGWAAAYILFSWTFIPVVVSLFECFVIRKRTTEYNEQCSNVIREKANIIFSPSEIPVILRTL